jgi:hypothetical protein
MENKKGALFVCLLVVETDGSSALFIFKLHSPRAITDE